MGCTDAGSKPMHTELHRSDENSGDGGHLLPKAVLSAKKVQLDAFRVNAPEGEFQISMDCTYRPNDVVPIVVGCALAGLVLMVLVAYLVGRRRVAQGATRVFEREERTSFKRKK